MEFFAEFLLEIYMELMFLIVPKAKRGNKKYRVIATLIAIAVLLGVAALALCGAILISKYKNPLGIIPIAVAAVISLSQILAGFVLYDKNH